MKGGVIIVKWIKIVKLIISIISFGLVQFENSKNEDQ